MSDRLSNYSPMIGHIQYIEQNHITASKHSKFISQPFNTFKPNEISHSYQLDKSISVFKVIE